MKDMAELMKTFEDFQKNTRAGSEIEFPLEILAIRTLATRPQLGKVGAWCSVRPVDATKTFLGVYLGDLTVSINHYLHVAEKTLTIFPHANPAIFVPDLKRVVWGMESWWGFIDSPERLRSITDADIENVWYVRALKDLTEERNRASNPLTED